MNDVPIKKPVVCLGVVDVDLVANPVMALPSRARMVVVDDMRLFPGGGMTNTGLALARLGIPVSVVGRLGHDILGDFLEKSLDDEGVNTQWIKRDPLLRTSATMVLVDPDGERRFIHYIGANGALTVSDVSPEALEGAGIFHVAYAFLLPGLDGDPMKQLLHKAQESGALTILDTVWDSQGRWMKLLSPVLPYVDYFVPNLAEAQALTGLEAPLDVARCLVDMGVKTVILKMNEMGCLAMDRSKAVVKSPAYPVDAVDSTGAGDCFNAGLIAGLWHGQSLQESLVLANAAGALCVSGRGALGKVSSLPDTQHFISSQRSDFVMQQPGPKPKNFS